MFFNYNILIKPGGRFYLVWRLVHQPRSRSAVSREDVDKLNIPELCDAVISHIPETAGYAELPYSLYLQAQLMHGIALVFNQQVGFLLKDVEEAANALKPVITKLPKKFKKRKVSAGEFQLSDFDVYSPAAKKTRGGEDPFGDFTVTRPIAVARVEDITLQEPSLMQPFSMFDNDDLGFLNNEEQRNFQELLAHGDFDVLETEAEPKRPSKRVTFSGLSPLRPETPVEHARLSGDARSAPSSGGRLIDHRDDHFELEQSVQDNFWPAPLSPTAAPGENLDVDALQRTPRQGPLQEEEVPMDVDQERPSEPYSFHLEPLGPTELELAGRKKPRSRRARAMRDNKTQFTKAEMELWQADYKSTCRPVVLVNPLQVPLETLFNPRPHMTKGLSEALMPLYGKVLIPVCELPMDPETKFTFDFYANHVRRLPIDLEGAMALALEQADPGSPPLAEVYLIGSLADPTFISLDRDAVTPQPDNVYEAPELHWDPEKQYSRKGLNDTGYATVEMTPLGTTSGGCSRTFEELLSKNRRKTLLTEMYTIPPFGHEDALSSRRSVLESPRASRRSMLETPPMEQHVFTDPFDGPYYAAMEEPRANLSIEHDHEAVVLSNFSLMVEPSGPEVTAKSRLFRKSPSPPPDAKNLLEKIKSSGAAAVVFSKLVPNNNKRAAARTFYSLLELLKHQQVKAAQQNAFGEILVRTVTTE